PAIAECDIPGGAVVVLDGGSSAARGGAQLVSLDWILDARLPTERALGSGALLTATIPLGAHAVTLLVTDSRGDTNTTEKTITVDDTAPPSLALTFTPGILWPPNHRLVPVHAAWHV